MKSTILRTALALLVLALLQFSIAQAVTVTAQKVSDTQWDFVVDVGTGEVVKDLHFHENDAVAGDATNIVLTGAPGDWVVDVANGHLNAYGATALAEGQTTITLDISAVTGKRFADMKIQLIVTDDGDNDPATGVGEGDTIIDVAPIITSAAIPTLSEWGLIIFALLILTLVTVVVARRRKAVAQAGA